MHRFIVSATVAAAASVCFAQDPMPPSTIPHPAGCNSWEIIFNEDFEGDAIDPDVWEVHADWGGIGSFNSGRERYYESQVRVGDGVCSLVAEIDTTVPYDDFTGTYKSGEILTCRDTPSGNPPYNFTFMYGYIEANVKIVNLPGFFCDFWMLPAKTNYTYEWEIDILESLGHDTRTMHQTYHYYPGLPYDVSRNTSWGTLDNPGLNGTGPVEVFSRDYHTFGCDWQEDRLAFYIDGIESGVFPTPGADNGNIPNSPGYIIAQQMVENTWIRSTGFTIPKLGLSETYFIDYIRVWQGTYDSTVSVEPTPVPARLAALTVGPNPAVNAIHFYGAVPVPDEVMLLDASGAPAAAIPVRARVAYLPDGLASGMYYVRDAAGSFMQRLMVAR